VYLASLRLRSFRNIPELDLELGTGRHLLWGENAQGKTNVLEAIFYLVTGRSFRTRADRECLPFSDVAAASRTLPAVSLIEGRVRRAHTGNDLRVVISAEGKQVMADGKPLERLGLLWGRLNAVLFTPGDLQLVQGGPSGRRRFLDTELAQIDAAYLAALQRFDRALAQRNSLLRQAGPRAADQPNTIDAVRRQALAFERPLAEAAALLTVARAWGLEFLSREAAAHYATISGGREILTLEYRPSLAIDGHSLMVEHQAAMRERLASAYAQRLQEGLAGDLRRGQTQIGPQRDDFDFRLDGHDARDFGSQGQQRSCVLALRLAEIALMSETTGEPPVLLLDDIVSELDESRRAALLGALPPHVQTVITATNAEALAAYMTGAPCFHIVNGRLAGTSRA